MFEFKLILKAIIKPHKIIKEIAKLKESLDLSIIDVVKYSIRLFISVRFFYYISKMIKTAKEVCKDPRLGGWIDFPNCFIIYLIIRHIRPDVVIETGVGPGGSSAFILKALNDNKKGILYSIDLPGNDAIVYPKIGKNFNIHVPNGWEVGWLIPPWLKNRHFLIIGDSRKELVKLLNRLNKKVDVFLHDSLHTDEHILMEFTTVFPAMSSKGVLLCDDVVDYWSLAFIKFCKDKGISFKIFNNRLGVAVLNK